MSVIGGMSRGMGVDVRVYERGFAVFFDLIMARKRILVLGEVIIVSKRELIIG